MASLFDAFQQPKISREAQVLMKLNLMELLNS